MRKHEDETNNRRKFSTDSDDFNLRNNRSIKFDDADTQNEKLTVTMGHIIGCGSSA